MNNNLQISADGGKTYNDMTTVDEKDLRKPHPLHMTDEEKVSFRFKKLVNGYFLLALILSPDTPLINNISLFAIVNTKPIFMQYVTFKMLHDDGFLIHLINKHFSI